MDNIGGRKFILSLICLIFLVIIFLYMAFNKWLTADRCMDFLPYISIILGTFTAGNLLDKKIVAGGNNGDKRIGN